MSRTTRLIGSVVTGTLVLVATAAAASADTPSVAIGPNQTFPVWSTATWRTPRSTSSARDPCGQLRRATRPQGRPWG